MPVVLLGTEIEVSIEISFRRYHEILTEVHIWDHIGSFVEHCRSSPNPF